MENKYKKNKGSAGLGGVQFQLDLLIISLLNALHSHTDWKISTENEEAGKFDDLVFQLPEKNVLLQAKFKQNNIVNKDQLFSCNSKKADFSLAKYFLWYFEITPKFEKKTVIICTNTGLNEKGLEGSLTRHCIDLNSVLHYEGTTSTYFTFNKKILPDLKASAESYLKANFQGKNIDSTIITDKNLEDFLENLQIFLNYPSGEKLHKIINRSLSRLNLSSLWCDMLYPEIYGKIEDWYKQPRGEYLTESRTNAMLCEIKSDKYCRSLINYNVCFEHNDFRFTDSKSIFHVKSDEDGLLWILKVFYSLQDEDCKKLYVNPDDSIQVQKQTVEAFELPRYKYLVIIWSGIKNEIVRHDMSQTLIKILQNNSSHKKVILVAERNIKLDQQIDLTNISEVDVSITFRNFPNDIQEKLLTKRCVIFQGKTINLKELLLLETSEDYAKFLDCVALEKLITGKDIQVGVRPQDLDEDTSWYYVSRKFESDINKTQRQSGVFTEEIIFDVSEKVIVISDSAGMGKSTVLTNMATYIKERYPRFWVIRANLNDYTRILRDSLRNDKQSISITELLNAQEDTKLSNKFEKLVFEMKEKVVLMLDGVDEISPDYTDLILSLLVQSQEASNFAKIFVTSRPHMVQELKAVLNFGLFKMIPFTRSNQVDFLTKYWARNLPLYSTKRNRIQLFAEKLIDKMPTWITYSYIRRASGNPFGANPLQLRMMAEIFQEKIGWMGSGDWEGCKEYLNGTEVEPKLLEKFNIARLYDMFIEKKWNIFIDKGNPTGNTAANQAFVSQFEECIHCHCCVALELMMSNKKVTSCKLDKKDMEHLVLKIGVVQRYNDEFQFVHRTFAEYFIAKSVITELLHLNPNVAFQRFLIDELLQDRNYNVVCAFLDCLLYDILDSLPSNIFNTYLTSTSTTTPKKYLIFDLAGAGWVTILRLILKSVDFRIVRGKKISMKYFRRYENNINTLKYLQMLLQQAGINIINENGETPLYIAIRNDQKEMVKFLMEQGTDVNIRDVSGDTALHAAIIFSNFNILKCLVEHIARVKARDSRCNTEVQLSDDECCNHQPDIDINVKNNKGHTALYLVVLLNMLDKIKYLVEKGADIIASDSKGRTPLHVAAHMYKLDTIEYLVMYGAGINIADNQGRTPLHVAANRCQLDAVQYLVEHGANVNIEDVRGRTPLCIAAHRHKLDIVDYLSRVDCSIGNRDSAMYLTSGLDRVESPQELEDENWPTVSIASAGVGST